ncbi:hypothetical protein ASG75_10020 [Rhodanobacter sp. Soil772]|nr:hypothetical protein ASG75_10020 [Rhodanobacter sp. Soil772]
MRSKLFVPGARQKLFAKALASEADALSFDLEDAIAEDRKAEAHTAMADFVAGDAVMRAAKLIIVRTNHHRLLEPIGYIPLAEAEANYYWQLARQVTPWGPDLNQTASTEPGAIQIQPIAWSEHLNSRELGILQCVTDPDQIGALLRDTHAYRGSLITQAALKLALLLAERLAPGFL